MLPACEVPVSLRLRLPSFLLLSALCSSQVAPSQTPATFSAHGRVVDDPGGKPLRKVGAQFTLHREPNNDEPSTMTDAEGVFEVENLKPGRYRVLLDRAGYVPLERRSWFGVNLNLRSAEGAKNLVLHMQAAAVITGKLLTATATLSRTPLWKQCRRGRVAPEWLASRDLEIPTTSANSASPTCVRENMC
jgi:carboxypeptidase family protein